MVELRPVRGVERRVHDGRLRRRRRIERRTLLADDVHVSSVFSVGKVRRVDYFRYVWQLFKFRVYCLQVGIC